MLKKYVRTNEKVGSKGTGAAMRRKRRAVRFSQY